ncbi:MAG TPA: DNA mismatch repair protein MutS [Gemmatimonadaceae bacterium]|nr:DNA mismatch repair protein MutS [Gemmatimonadaceae bacterium]
MSKEGSSATPLMAQYREIKARHPNAILFFRMGEFYEMFHDDAETASRVLGLTLTSRNNGGAAEVPLAGVPVKAAADYVRRLVQQGHRVAICEQVEDPRQAKGIVRREVIETVTPGAAFSDDLLDGARNNFLCAVQTNGREVGLAAVDLSTGEFRLVIARLEDADAALARVAPREVLVPTGSDAVAGLVAALGAMATEREAWEFDAALASDALAQHFAVQSLEGFGIGAADAVATAAAGALLRYLRELQPSGIPHLARPSVERPGGTMPLDEMTRRNLELVESLRAAGDTAGTLLGVLDRTQTPMGARLLRQWILAPLTDVAAISARLDAVESLVSDAIARAALRDALDGVRDVERLGGKTAAGRATPRDVRALGDSLARLPDVARVLAGMRCAGALGALRDEWDDAAALAREVLSTLVERPPLAYGEGETIAPGVDATLDDLRAIASGGKDAIAALQAAERERTGIASLKVGYNRVFGYYIEVSNANRDLVPADYQRRQTLTGAERYVTPALKEFEEKVLHATERMESLERELFEALRARVGSAIGRLQAIGARVARLDVFASLAEVAAREGYVRPVVDGEATLEIVRGRHPVVERMMPRDQFIPNDVRLAPDERTIILTGPNMAGKSTILRQIGLLVLMAQMGSYVPAASARVGIADRVFTRVGASDNLVRGQSTFMVEMSETSAILHTATERSLVLLDEIGRGTATWDGLSIAWAVSEHLHARVGCKTVFATHYHELTQLAGEFEAVRNFNVAVREAGERILFLHRLQPGGADRSYGIEVGRLAGLPAPVIARARELLKVLESEQLVPAVPGRRNAQQAAPTEQLALFGAASDPALERLRDRLAAIDTDALTPRQALDLLAELSADAAGHSAAGHSAAGHPEAGRAPTRAAALPVATPSTRT